MIAPAGAERADRGLPRAARLRRRVDFLRCYQSGSRRPGALLALHWSVRADGPARLGVTVGRKVGGAVVRHRLKRWVRECFRQWPARGELAALDLVVHLRPPAAAAGFAAFRRELEGLLAAVAKRVRGRS